MVASLIEHGSIKTTLPKAKSLRSIAEKIITLAKTDTLARRRLAFDRIRDRQAVVKLFKEVAPLNVSRPGGYTRILKCGYRQGDNAPMAIIELVERSAAINE